MFGIYMTFVHPLFRREDKEEDKLAEDWEDEVVTRVKRRIELKWGWYCVCALLLWILLIVGIVVLVIHTARTHPGSGDGVVSRWIDERLRETWRLY